MTIYSSKNKSFSNNSTGAQNTVEVKTSRNKTFTSKGSSQPKDYQNVTIYSSRNKAICC